MQDPSIENLLEHYKIAVDLYRHEDDLNWRKLNNMFYVNAALFAAVGFLIKHNQVEAINSLCNSPEVKFVAVIGVIIAFGFGIALIFGIKYMLYRKEAVVSIEDKLEAHGVERIVSRSYHKRFYYKISWTTWMLRLMPFLFVAAWTALLFISNIVEC